VTVVYMQKNNKVNSTYLPRNLTFCLVRPIVAVTCIIISTLHQCSR